MTAGQSMTHQLKQVMTILSGRGEEHVFFRMMDLLRLVAEYAIPSILLMADLSSSIAVQYEPLMQQLTAARRTPNHKIAKIFSTVLVTQFRRLELDIPTDRNSAIRIIPSLPLPLQEHSFDELGKECPDCGLIRPQRLRLTIEATQVVEKYYVALISHCGHHPTRLLAITNWKSIAPQCESTALIFILLRAGLSIRVLAYEEI